MKQLATELVWYDQTNVEQRHVGSILITPHPRQLPNEIITLILGHLANDLDTLYRCLFVTKQVSRIATSLLWRTPNLPSRRTSRLFLGSLQAASPERRSILGRYVRRLDLDAYWWDNEELTSLLPYIPLEAHCIVWRELLTPTPIQQLTRHCQYLTTLYINVGHLTETYFIAIGQHCPYLRDIEWYVKLVQMPAWLKYLASSLKRLRLVCHDKTIQEEALTVIQGMEQLRCLELYQDSPDSLTHLLGSHWPHLTKLCLGPCATITEHTWIDFFASHPYLEYVDLEELDTWTSLPSLPRLTYLSLHGNSIITSKDLRRYIRHSPQLVSVWIWQREQVVAEDFPVDNGGAIRLDKRAIASIKASRIDGS